MRPTSPGPKGRPARKRGRRRRHPNPPAVRITGWVAGIGGLAFVAFLIIGAIVTPDSPGGRHLFAGILLVLIGITVSMWLVWAGLDNVVDENGRWTIGARGSDRADRLGGTITMTLLGLAFLPLVGWGLAMTGLFGVDDDTQDLIGAIFIGTIGAAIALALVVGAIGGAVVLGGWKALWAGAALSLGVVALAVGVVLGMPVLQAVGLVLLGAATAGFFAYGMRARAVPAGTVERVAGPSGLVGGILMFGIGVAVGIPVLTLIGTLLASTSIGVWIGRRRAPRSGTGSAGSSADAPRTLPDPFRRPGEGSRA